MIKLKHNDPCHCGSKKKYRSCHLQQDRATRERSDAAKARTAAIQSQTRQSSPRWVRGAALALGGVGAVAAIAVGMTFDTDKGVGVLVVTGIVVVALFILGDPPPPKDNPGDPAAINFGRK